MVRNLCSSVLPFIALALASCPRAKKSDPVNGDRAPYVAAFADCAASSAADFKTKADALVAAAAAYQSSPSTATRDAARGAFHAAMENWQMNEALRFGPAAPRSAPGGMDLRDHIYSWPLVSRCAVEEQIVAKGYETSAAGLLINQRGLAALEYLLFFEGSDTACTGSSAIVSSGSWAALTDRDARKRLYALRVSEDVARRAGELVTAWDPAGGNFKERMLGTDVYPTTQRALNAVSDAMLSSVEGEVKDMKLARPLGLRDCSSAVCPEQLESQFAARSLRNVEANLKGFRKLMYGCGANDEGKGFDDLLVSLNQQGVVDRIKAADAATTAALNAISPADLSTELTANPQKVRALYDALAGITSVLKTDLVSNLDLELPMAIEGDVD